MGIPPLQEGERLSRAEFERRYDAMPNLKKAELIEGVVHVPSPVNFNNHGNPHFDLISWLGWYRSATPGVLGGANSSIRLDMGNEPQPDACLIVAPTLGGQVQIDADGYIVGGPELVAEVAASSVRTDLGNKRIAYRRNGIREYIIWRVLERAIDWYVLRGDDYELLPLLADGVYRSEVYPGLWLNMAALVAGNSLAVAQTVQQGVASPEHANFVARLARAASSGKE
ncbi:MAG: Uma2 family endonuclease [Gemmataceae bacterium]|nr:Uma2 family endonuclease [Gemmataceae bacterium]